MQYKILTCKSVKLNQSICSNPALIGAQVQTHRVSTAYTLTYPLSSNKSADSKIFTFAECK